MNSPRALLLLTLSTILAVGQQSVSAQAPISAPRPSLTGPPQPAAVIASLAAKQETTGLAAGGTAFDAPPGDGRRGAKGIVWKNEVANLRGGSTWSLRYVRGGSAQSLQLIHPVGRGQGIVDIGRESVWFTAPKSWTDVRYGGGGEKPAKETKAFQEIFPLVDGQEYELTSCVSVGGGLDLYINQKLVATGRVAGASPFSLKEAGAVWTAGWAGIIVGAIDRGENRCADVRFTPGLTPPTPKKP